MKLKILYVGNKLSKHGNNLSYLETLGPLLESEGHRLIYSSDKKNKALRFLNMLITLINQKNKIDVVIIDTYSTLNYWYAIAISKLCIKYKIPYIPILHGGNLPHRAKSSKKTFSFLIEGAFTAVCPSLYLENALSDLGHGNFTVLRNMVEIDQYDFYKRSIPKPNFLWVRSFSKIYNPEMAVRVFNKIKQDHPEARLCMIGPDKDGSLEATQKLAQSLNLDVEFTGKMSKEAWREKSKDFDIFLNTTHFDNVPISVIESMALGLPVVSTNVGGIPYLLEDNKTALLVEDNNEDEMVAAINKLLTDHPFSAQISEAARHEAEKYSWNVVRKDWQQLLSTVPKKT